MWFRNIKQPVTLSEDLVERVWDCNSRIKQLEDRFDAQLDELSKRYRRAEQSEARFELKKQEPCSDAGVAEGADRGGAFAALKRRQSHNSRNGVASSRTEEASRGSR